MESETARRLTKKRLLLLAFVVIIPLYTFCGWMSKFQFPKPPIPTHFKSSHERNLTTVLLWSWPFGSHFNLDGDVCQKLYHIPRCLLISQRLQFSTADFVVFHNRELMHGEKLPLHLPRPQGQRWVWMSLESPPHNGNVKQYVNIFNLTMSYRRDSDISIPYGELVPNPNPGKDLDLDLLENKTHLACWLVSNYRTGHKRTAVYQQLKSMVPIKVYGRWSGNPLSPSEKLPTLQRCWFYLAFENSQAKDYITEKLWDNSYLAGTVPVVLGAPLADYKAVAPPHSFIHVDEFASLKDLGEYLKELVKDKKRYREYFNWRKDWKVTMNKDWRKRLCTVCSKQDSFPKYKVYSDLDAWSAQEHQ
ncbi:alpha-(1,3)-fucosyltransferase 7-like [Synchiropus splendidus]|uniref:alpha-(1,3)-fucosyltransferase 7-like n=1 Tax=Synchiropus splendidus TaxID=270530 RepID=UPI00237DF6A4|nr:alpha-(1,3)-fucosyltransferase 7-like [Synchiropus splendidus]